MGKPFSMNYKTYDTSKGHGNPKDWRKSFNQRMFSAEELEAVIGSYKAGETVYSILGITEGASQAEIKKAYRIQLMKWHPDKNPDNQIEAGEMTKKIIAAYEKLSD